MEWVEQKHRPQLPPEVAVELWREAAAMPDASPDALLRLSEAHHRLGDVASSLVAVISPVDRRRDHAAAWRNRASLHLDLGEDEAALRASERAGPRGGLLRARALARLDRTAEAEELLRKLLAEGAGWQVFEPLARLIARAKRGEALMDLCDANADRPGCATAVLAYRAVALGLMGRHEAARRIIDPQRHVKQVAFVPPAEFGSLDRFNANLADQILRGYRPVVRDGFSITYDPDYRAIPNLRPLHDFMRREMAGFVDELPQRGLDGVMRPPPPRIRLHSGVSVLRGRGYHGDHIHPRGYISCVYHVLVPDEIAAAEDLCGQLAIGIFEGLTPDGGLGWEVLYLRPRPGILTIFPSHMFHDVVPTRIEAPRVATAGDLEPATE